MVLARCEVRLQGRTESGPAGAPWTRRSSLSGLTNALPAQARADSGAASEVEVDDVKPIPLTDLALYLTKKAETLPVVMSGRVVNATGVSLGTATLKMDVQASNRRRGVSSRQSFA